MNKPAICLTISMISLFAAAISFMLVVGDMSAQGTVFAAEAGAVDTYSKVTNILLFTGSVFFVLFLVFHLSQKKA